MTSRAQFFISAFTEEGGDETIGSMRLAHLARVLSAGLERFSELDPEEVDDLAWAFDSLAINAARSGEPESTVAELASRAFHVRTALWSSRQSASLYDLWMLVVSGTLAQRQPELRLLLSDYSWPTGEPDTDEDSSWVEQVWQRSAVSLGLLARKSRSWLDVDEAVNGLYALAELQNSREAELFTDPGYEDWRDDKQKCKLLGMYHVAESLVALGSYLRTGDSENIRPVLQRHGEHARNLLASTGEIEFERIGESVEALTLAMARASIWFNTTRLSQAAREFVRRLAGDDRVRPVSELWWSQREALAKSLLDPYKTAVSVQMPTSAGKTLMAEFSIVQTMALNPASTIAYLVPTRALVNQMTRRLRNDLMGATAGGESVTVEAAVPVFELDPTESGLLSSRPDVLVTTPEKLDLLVRADHPSVADISLVVVDEAHHIADTQRGARLELLLATIKRERGASCRFLLLTPFLPNANELSFWLGDEGGVAIELNWKPSEQVRALGKWLRKSKKYRDTLCLVPSATQQGWDDAELDLGEALLQPDQRQRPAVSTSLAIKLSQRTGGGTLVLTGGPGYAEARALQVAEHMPELASGDEGMSLPPIFDAAIDYISRELGSSYPLARVLRHGVAFHHAGLPPEVRYLVELLLNDGHLRVVTGTSTLAQGVDFPISSVVIETLTVRQGRGMRNRPLMYSEFWNIAGRAGRALRDSMGLVVYPSISKDDDAAFRKYLEDEAVKVVSALLGAIQTLDDLRPEYNLSLVRQQPVLSHFFQYLTHALKVAGYDTASAEVEEILRSSLAFHTLQANDRSSAESLVSWTRSFLAQMRRRPLLGVADTTGLSLPSVGFLSSAAPAAFRDPEFWLPENLFGDDLRSLSSVVELLADVPEMSLGMPDESGGFNARRVAGILRDWVRGASLPEIADAWFGPGRGELSRVGRYLFRELSGQLPWGIGALQMIELSGNESERASLARHVPAMSFYGVDSIDALPMRMVGVPRAAARRLGEQAPEFGSFGEARRWVSGLPDAMWRSVAREKGFQPGTLKTVWEAVGGSAG